MCGGGGGRESGRIGGGVGVYEQSGLPGKVVYML